METSWTFWIGFNVFVLLMLALDLGVIHRKARSESVKAALLWTGFWILLSLVFAALVYYWGGTEKAMEYLTGYMIEKALSLDNIFVIAMIFTYFKTPAIHQHRILFWGIIGALAMRLVFILAGVVLLEKFHWSIYVFGAILIYTGVRIIRHKHKDLQPEKNPVIRFLMRHLPFTSGIGKGTFFVRENGKLMATPLFMVLLVVEITDVMFAVDSIPAILSISQDRFIVYTSNVFAVLGLRSLYFALAGIIDRFTYLQAGLSIILIFVGIKMLIADFVQIPVWIALLVVVGVLGGSILLSYLREKRPADRAPG